MQKGTNITSNDTSCSNKASEVNSVASFFTYENLYNSYLKCIKGVKWKETTQHYMLNAWYRIALIHNQIVNGKYKMGGIHFFKVYERGKIRNISALNLNDRIVHKCFCDYYLTPLLSKKLIYDSGATIKGKGILFAKNRVITHLQRHYRKYGTKGYVLKIDFHNYFESINHDILINKLSNVINNKEIIEFAKQVIPNEIKGLGLGSQVSQICAMFYLNEIDHFCKEKLRLKNYARYMDDIYAIDISKARLKNALKHIEKMANEIGIGLNKNKTKIIELWKGFEFCKCKYILTNTGKVIKLIRSKSFKTMKNKIRKGVSLTEIIPSWRAYISWFNCYKRQQMFVAQNGKWWK